jgi:hypothetical protein
MLAAFAIELAPAGRCSHLVFADDDRRNFPARDAAGDAQPRDAWRLCSTATGVEAPNVTMVAWPAGAAEGGHGLDSSSMKGIAAIVAGR